ncbi:RluA family pseudouridine synthase [Skermanella mucosa]|uniref:RluA family pseudouridine synthase n=1 Tax=Skermanella mucosa TaxID=1789672 RepID=UPI00192C24C3|nr:RluA family pseudouridine synthase [Skermanella mucosa]UEM20504.1 RluA family pseudouridine synthase [Skermanella mucosa]
MTAEELRARVLHLDHDVLILDKPAGLLVHPGPRGQGSLGDFLPGLWFEMARPPALAHRLDRDTSGCLVLGRHQKALKKLGRLFARGLVGKTYWAVVRGLPPADQGRVDLPLLKVLPETGGWRIRPDPAGLPAATEYRVLGAGAGISWLELKPLTGRTHQLRIHCASLGTPILGDPFYGGEGEGENGPLRLLARSVTLPLHAATPPITAVAPPPPHMRDDLAACGYL